MDALVTWYWGYTFGLGCFIGLLGVATGSMGISYSKVTEIENFKILLKRVTIMVQWYCSYILTIIKGICDHFAIFWHFLLARRNDRIAAHDHGNRS